MNKIRKQLFEVIFNKCELKLFLNAQKSAKEMGSGISDNFNNINPTFTSRFWKVHSATRKSTGEPVSLWLLDTKEVKRVMKSKLDCQKFNESCIESVNKQRRIHHPNILKIYDVSENPKQFGFSAEPVESTLESDKALNADDITYVADQLAQTLSFIHCKVNLLHLGLTPDSICLTKSLQVKVFALNYSTPFIGEPVIPSYGKYLENPLNPNVCYTAPEYLENKQVTAASDVFSYGAVLFAAYNKKGPVYMATTVEEAIVTVSAGAFKTPDNMSEPMHDLLLKCMSYEPNERPTIEEIIKSPAFLQLSIRSLRFISLLATKEVNDRMQFFQGLTRSLPLFSERILQYHFLPIFVEEVRNSTFYGPVLIPVIFSIGEKFDDEAFVEQIIQPLRQVLKIVEPPTLAIAILNVVHIIVAKVPDKLQNEIIFPIFINSLQSPHHNLRLEAIKHIPHVIQTMSESNILGSLLPTLLDFIATFDDTEIVCSVIECIGKCSIKVNNDKFVFVIIPKLIICWIRMPRAPIALSIISVLTMVKCSITSQMKFIVPMATAIMSTPGVPSDISGQLADIILDSITRLKEERNIEERAASWHPTESHEKEDIVVPIKADALDIKEIELARRRSSESQTHLYQMGLQPPGSSIVAEQHHDDPTLQQGQQPQSQQLAPDEGNEPKKSKLASLFHFGKKKNENSFNVEGDTPSQAPYVGPPAPPPNTHLPPGPLPSSNYGSVGSTQPYGAVGSSYGSMSQQQQPSIPQSSYIAPQVGPPGPLPNYGMQQQQQQYQQPHTQYSPRFGQPIQQPGQSQMQPQGQELKQGNAAQGASLFAGLSAGPPPKKTAPTNPTAAKLFSGLNVNSGMK
ncbi:protein kinase [Tritrichomonas foetus]|uniref:Protein kinase n=1 Tax=Tritrichomonas foetus TaxID=1144522 RepID=A0A1J4K4C1_9EUKA|nr:protein kinase [Tritrichomonas foetus]|eukprot:OHT04534.1 protein kinase [Tritrichomonas foetus]